MISKNNIKFTAEPEKIRFKTKDSAPTVMGT